MNDEMKPIDLGHKPGEGPYGSPLAMPEKDMEERQYPEFNYSGPVELDLPDHGVMEIEFCKCSETSSKRPDGSHWYECRIKVKKLLEVESDEEEENDVTPPTRRDHSTEEALDKLAEALQERKGNSNGNPGSGY